MKERKRQKNNHSLSPTSEYLHHDESLQRDNFDPYLKPLEEEPDPEKVVKRASLLHTVVNLLSPFHK